jgi:hypothetical protein
MRVFIRAPAPAHHEDEGPQGADVLKVQTHHFLLFVIKANALI